MQGLRQEEQYRDFLRRFRQLSEADGHPVVLHEFEERFEAVPPAC